MHLFVDLVVITVEDVDNLGLELEDVGNGPVVEVVLISVAVFLAASEVEDEVPRST